jgi:ATP-dependent Clp endopeptidase proteolytic subunit ClpP
MDRFSFGPKKKKVSSKEEDAEKEEKTPQEEKPLLDPLKLLPALFGAPPGGKKEELRLTGIYGTITEERCLEAIYSLHMLMSSGRYDDLEDPSDENSPIIEKYDPIDFIISSYGGSAAEMFSVYDTIGEMKKKCEVRTIGLGKVMSAGVLLLACGTKGKRKIGANCRVMIHGVISGQHGHLHDVENEFEEAKLTQEAYIKALAANSNMKPSYIKKLIQRKTNVYLNASEAVELGIADIII